jgi:hypothetical protein
LSARASIALLAAWSVSCAPVGRIDADAAFYDDEDAGAEAQTWNSKDKLGLSRVLSTVIVAGAGANQPPVMRDLSDVLSAVGVAFAISGSCTDDGKPTPRLLTYQWTQTGGSGSCIFASSTSATTTATCDTIGTAQLTLTCCDQGPAAACTGLTDSDTLATTVFGPERAALLAALGANLIEAGEVTDDATTVKMAITPVVNVPGVYRCDSVASFAPAAAGKVYQALSAEDVPDANRRPYWHATGGPANDPHIELANISFTNTGLSSSFSAPTGHRYSFFAVAAMNDSGVQSSFMMVRNQGGDKVGLRLQDVGMRELSWTAISGLHARAVYADSEIEWLGPISSPAAMGLKQWSLISNINATTGNLLEINGAGTTAQYAQSKALFSGTAQTHFNLGDTSVSGTDAPRTKLKMWLVVNEVTPAMVTAIEAYVAAKWPDVFIGSKASIGMWGQSNAEQALRFALSTANYINSDWHWAGGYGAGGSSLADWAPASANYNHLRDWMIRADATKPLVVVWWQGETDANDATLSDQWRSNWEAIVDQLDEDTERTDAIFIIMRLASGYIASYTTTVRARQEAWVTANPSRARMVNLDDLTRHDGVHYDDASKVIGLGRATSYLPEIYPRRPGGSVTRP